jgi:hypothetical protein
MFQVGVGGVNVEEKGVLPCQSHHCCALACLMKPMNENKYILDDLLGVYMTAGRK